MTIAFEVTLFQTHKGHKTEYVSYNKRVRTAKIGKRWTVYCNGVVAGFIRYDMEDRSNSTKEWQSPGWFVRPYGQNYHETISKHQAITEILTVFEETLDTEWDDLVD